jgi:chromosome segregation ATPase
MARTGVTEAQVHAAADALVVAGEKPTIERLRGHLGTGSPNTLLRALETWWSTLGQRLSAQRNALAMPGAPESVVVAANRLWSNALEHAREWAQGQVAAERELVEATRRELEQGQAALLAERTGLERSVAQAQFKQEELAERFAETKEHLTLCQSEIQELKRERTITAEERKAAEAFTAGLQRRLDTLDGATNAALNELRAQSLKSEEHWLREVDRLRQEIKGLQKQQATERKASQDAARQARAEIQQATRAKSEVERHLAAARAEAATLDRQLKRLSLPKANPRKSVPRGAVASEAPSRSKQAKFLKIAQNKGSAKAKRP